MAGHGKEPRNNVIAFPRSKKERRKILRESEDKRVRLCAKLRTAVGWLLAVGVFLFLLANYRLLTPSSIRSLTSYAIAGLRQHEGDISSIVYENGSLADGTLFGTGLAYADGDTLYLAKPGGLTTMKKTLAYASPVVESGGEYVLAYDRGGHGATLSNSVAPVAELTLASPIITGSITGDGYFTLVTDEQGYRTAVYVYNNRGAEVFKWQTSEYYILSAALSPDGKTLAALAFQQNNVSLDTKVLLFSVGKGEKEAEATLPGTLGLEVAYLSNGTVAALCDDGLYTVGRKGQAEQAISYSANDLLAFSLADDMLALATRSYSGSARSDIYLMRASGKVEGPYPAAEEPSALAVSRAGVAALTASGVSVYDTSFKPQWRNPEAVGARRVLLTDDGSVFALYAKQARIFTAHSTRSEDIPNDTE